MYGNIDPWEVDGKPSSLSSERGLERKENTVTNGKRQWVVEPWTLFSKDSWWLMDCISLGLKSINIDKLLFTI